MMIAGLTVTIIATSISMMAPAESLGLRSLNRYKLSPTKGRNESETALLAIIKDTPLAVSDGEILSTITPFSPMGGVETLAWAVSPLVLSIIVARSSSSVHCGRFIIVDSLSSVLTVHRRWIIVVGFEVDVVHLIVAVIACLF